MFVELLVPLAVGAGAFIMGALFRQPEINRLKRQVKKLQDEIERLTQIIETQSQQIRALKRDYKSLRAYQYLEKERIRSKTRGALIHQYAYKEYISLCCRLAAKESISESERLFFNTYENLLHGIETEEKAIEVLKNYIATKYKKEINSFIEVKADEVLKTVKEAKIA